MRVCRYTALYRGQTCGLVVGGTCLVRGASVPPYHFRRGAGAGIGVGVGVLAEQKLCDDDDDDWILLVNG